MKYKSTAEFESFNERVIENSKKYNTLKKAYEKTEAEHKQETGHRRFSCYQSFKSARHRWHYKKKR